ncbi:MAG TPA: group 1 truncated hemoglobin [Gemmataceae bacterium]|nr:group 1 truncated hemoglobin [Gemmataceae bacterium]
MPAFRRRLGQVLVAALLLTGFTGRTNAQDAKQLDQHIYDLLKDVINTGADVYNARAEDRDMYTRENNRAGCYRIYQGSLLTVKPLLGHHPQLQTVIDNSFAKAATQTSMAERAFTLREALDEVRRVVKPGGEEKTTGGPTPSDPSTIPLNSSSTLWVRLGGESKVKKIVDEWLARAGTDPKVDLYRKGKFKLTDLELQTTKSRYVDYISGISKGPKSYAAGGGRPMASVHKDMGITNAEFTAMLQDLKLVLDANDVKSTEGIELLQILEKTRKDIVEPKAATGPASDGFKTPK